MAEMLVYPLDNTYYQANGLGSWLATRDRGVFSADDNLRVEAAGGMSVRVLDGLSWHKMSKYWGCSGLLENPTTLTSNPSDGVLDRYDIAVARLNKITNTGEVVIKEGQFSSSPVIPEPVRDTTYDELYLAAWLIRRGSVDIKTEDIQDLRLNEQYCGLMRDGVEKIPTAALNAQAEALINNIKEVLAGVIDGSQYMLAAEYAGETYGVVADSEKLGGVDAAEWSPINEGTFEYTQTVTGNTVTFQSRLGTPAFTPVNGIVQINAPIPANPVFIVDGNTVPAYLGDSTVSELPVGRWSSFVYDGTQINFKSGGAGLNYKIVGGTSQPTNPIENMIWVNTDVAITGYSFSSTQPTGSQGLLWVSTSNVSPVAFNALKKNALWVYPVGIRIYNLGAWVMMQPMIFIGGMWHPLQTQLFDNGEQFTSLTGGWGSNNRNGITNVTSITPDFTFTHVSSAGYTGCATVTPYNAIDFTPYTTLYAECQTSAASSNPNWNAYLGVFSSRTAYWTYQNGNGGIIASTLVNQAAFNTFSVDVSGINQTAYPGFIQSSNENGTRTFSFRKVWLV